MLFSKIVLIYWEKIFLVIKKNFEITRIFYLKCERSEYFEAERFINSLHEFPIISNTLEQLKYQLEQTIGM